MLYKFCKPENNISLGGPTIRLGTLEYYRDMDPSIPIADPQEGVDTYDINYFEGFSRSEECRDFMRTSGFGVLGPRDSVINSRVAQNFTNIYIWCCGNFDAPPNATIGLRPDPAYTSCYEVVNPMSFANYVAGRIGEELTIDNLSDRSQQHLMHHGLDVRDLRVHCIRGPVSYVQKKVGRYDPNFVQHYSDLPPEIRSIFVKPMKYQEEAEYRFVFPIVCPKTDLCLEVKPAPFDIKAPPVPQII